MNVERWVCREISTRGKSRRERESGGTRVFMHSISLQTAKLRTFTTASIPSFNKK
jgi:hypothetical protein